MSVGEILGPVVCWRFHMMGRLDVTKATTTALWAVLIMLPEAARST
jgi:hypothetical protein